MFENHQETGHCQIGNMSVTYNPERASEWIGYVNRTKRTEWLDN